MGLFSLAKLFGITIRESANDGSDFTNPDADYRRLFLGEDGQLHVKDSAGTVTDIGSATTSDHNHTAAGGDGGDLDAPVIDGYAVFNEESAPSTPSSGTVAVYAKSDGLMYSKDDAGVETVMTGGGGSAGALVLLEQHTASASATLDFTTFISATYDTYQFEFVNIIPATDAALFYMRMGTGGGPTYDAGTNYSWAQVRYLSSTSSIAGANSGANQITLIGAIDTSSALWSCNGSAKFFNPEGAIYKPINAEFFYLDNALSIGAGLQVRGQYNSATAVTAVRFLMSTGNIASGTIRVYGLAK